MMARVQLDAGHVSRSVTARREKVTRYLRVYQRTFKVRTFRLYSLRLRVLEHTMRENIARFLESSRVLLLKYLVVQSLTWALECDRPQRCRSVLLQVLEVDRDEGRSLKRCTCRSKFDEASSNVLVNRQDQVRLSIGIPYLGLMICWMNCMVPDPAC